MRQTLFAVLLGCFLSVSSIAWAAETYRLQVDGLACAFCAYGVEKKLNNTEGVEAVDIRINSGVVLVTVSEDAGFNKAYAERIMEEAGFTLRGFEKTTGAAE